MVAHENVARGCAFRKRNDATGPKVRRAAQVQDDRRKWNDMLRSDERGRRLARNLVERTRFVENERPRCLAHECAHVRGHSDRVSEIVTKRANVRAFTACDAKTRNSFL